MYFSLQLISFVRCCVGSHGDNSATVMSIPVVFSASSKRIYYSDRQVALVLLTNTVGTGNNIDERNNYCI